jgi:hypothetical protein
MDFSSGVLPSLKSTNLGRHCRPIFFLLDDRIGSDLIDESLVSRRPPVYKAPAFDSGEGPAPIVGPEQKGVRE